MANSPTYLCALLDGVDATHASLHTADPGADGSNEVATEGYARIAITEAAAVYDAQNAKASRAINSATKFTMAAGSSAAFLGYWNGPDFLCSVDVPDEAWANPGECDPGTCKRTMI